MYANTSLQAEVNPSNAVIIINITIVIIIITVNANNYSNEMAAVVNE